VVLTNDTCSCRA